MKEEVKQTAAQRKRRARYFAVCCTLVVAAVVCTRIDLSKLLDALADVGVPVAFALLLLYTVAQAISALKWRLLLQHGGVERTVSEVIRAYFAGMFINSFGLGTVGGDLARALALQPRKGQRTATLASVAADRIHGLSVLLSIGIFGAIFSENFLGRTETREFGPLVLLMVALGWWLGPRILVRLARTRSRFTHVLQMAAQAFPTEPRLLIATTVLAASVHCIQISMHVLIAQAIGIEIPLLYFFAIIPLVNIISCLPFSVQGIGVREGLYLLLLTPLGVPSELAVALGVTWVLVITSVSLLSGLFLSSPISGWSLQGFRKRLASEVESSAT